MTKFTLRFIDGPVAGQSLFPERAAIMIRVGINPQGQARCFFGDADPQEVVYAYIQHGNGSSGFWDGRDNQGKRIGGTMFMGSYQLLDEQPEPRILCDSKAWMSWCETNKSFLLAKHEATKKKTK